jgi:hypothetical protein
MIARFRHWRWRRAQERRRVPFGIPAANVAGGRIPPPGRGYYADMPYLHPYMDAVTRLHALGRHEDADELLGLHLWRDAR